MIRYTLVNWVFNKGLFASQIRDQIDAVGIDVVASMLDVTPKTVYVWAKMYDSAYSDYPYPSMTTVMKFVNAFDYDPREYFMLEDK